MVELITPNLAAAKNFYAGLFGWTFRDRQTGGTVYAEALLNGRSVAGLVYRPLPANEKRSPAWLGFFSVRDVDAATQTALQHGGRVLFGPRTIPDRGREAVLADPQGAIFAVIASNSGDPPDSLAEPGSWIWSSLITRDPNADAGFYQALFDYDVFTLPTETGGQHLILASGNYARASANTVPASQPDLQPHWLNFIRVDDAASTATRAATLGARILVAPRTDRDGNTMAVIADPFGAVLGLLEWRDTESEGPGR
ncbi:MAG: VOC family protein [Acetobacteraceae bacterium]|nr:VOC family protein [Acetobacteraceae bacterium]